MIEQRERESAVGEKGEMERGGSRGGRKGATRRRTEGGLSKKSTRRKEQIRGTQKQSACGGGQAFVTTAEEDLNSDPAPPRRSGTCQR